MHRGTAFIIIKNEKKEFEVQKSTEFNGGMGLDCHGKELYEMLNNLKDPLLFDSMIRDFDKKNFEYYDKTMTYCADEESKPYISENGENYFEYAKTDNQFRFFKDNNGDYIYTSDSNYIKNMSDEEIKIVCSNGCFVLKPNQILLSDYDECVNNSKETFGKKLEIEVDTLETTDYIPTKKEEVILKNIVETFEEFNFNVSFISQNGMNNGIEIETWTDGGVNMIHSIYFWEDNSKLYDVDEISKELQNIFDSFSVDDEIDIYRQNDDYKRHFSIRDSLEDFEDYQNRLENLTNNFSEEYHRLIYKKFMDNEIEMEMYE